MIIREALVICFESLTISKHKHLTSNQKKKHNLISAFTSNY